MGMARARDLQEILKLNSFAGRSLFVHLKKKKTILKMLRYHIRKQIRLFEK